MKLGITKKIRTVFTNITFIQSLLLLLGNIFAIILAFIFNIIVTNSLSVEHYGVYRYIVNFQLFLIPVVMLGWQYSVGRLLAVNSNESEQKELVGFGLLKSLYCGIIGFLGAIVFYIANYYIGVEYNINRLLLITSIFIFIPLSLSFFENILQGLNKIRILSFSKVLLPILQILFLLPWILMMNDITINIILIGYFASMAIVILIINYLLNTRVKNVRYWHSIVKEENKVTGVHVYIGSLFGITALQGTIFITGNLISMDSYGHLTLAITLAAPLAIIPTVLGTVMYKRNANSKKIDNKLMVITIIVNGISLILYLYFLELLFNQVYKQAYRESLIMSQMLAVGYLMNGIGNFFNKYLSARSRGRDIKRGSIYNGLLTIIIASVSIPLIGVWGAIVTIITSSMFYLLFMIYFYYKSINHH